MQTQQWLIAIGAIGAIGLMARSGLLWYQVGHEAGWVRWPNDGVAFISEAKQQHDTYTMAATTGLVIQRESRGSESEPIYMISVMKHRIDGLMFEASTEATADPCR